MTAYAAARIPVSADLADDAAPLIASMLSAGLDRDAAAWSQAVETGTDAWAMIALGTANPQLPIPSSDIEAFYSAVWSRRISLAADYRNEGLVALLAGLGMQGSNWDQMTPLHLYHIVSALNQVGMSAEARMIAAEAIARS